MDFTTSISRRPHLTVTPAWTRTLHPTSIPQTNRRWSTIRSNFRMTIRTPLKNDPFSKILRRSWDQKIICLWALFAAARPRSFRGRSRGSEPLAIPWTRWRASASRCACRRTRDRSSLQRLMVPQAAYRSTRAVCPATKGSPFTVHAAAMMWYPESRTTTRAQYGTTSRNRRRYSKSATCLHSCGMKMPGAARKMGSPGLCRTPATGLGHLHVSVYFSVY